MNENSLLERLELFRASADIDVKDEPIDEEDDFFAGIEVGCEIDNQLKEALQVNKSPPVLKNSRKKKAEDVMTIGDLLKSKINIPESKQLVKPKGRPRKRTVEVNTEKAMEDRVMAILNEVKKNGNKCEIQRIALLEPVRRASAGFQEFIHSIDDHVCKLLVTFICDSFEAPDETDVLRVPKILRHVWNMMGPNFRKGWEWLARRSFRNSTLKPLSEVLLFDDGNKELVKVDKEFNQPVISRYQCCSLEPTLSSLTEFTRHFTQQHDYTRLFACQFCMNAFPNEGLLLKHDCIQFQIYRGTQTSGRIEFTRAVAFIACTQCGICLSLREKNNNWVPLNALAMGHSSKSMVPIVVLFADEFLERKLNEKTVRLRFFPQLKAYIPTKCDECGVEEFSSVKEIDQHFLKHNSFACQLCGEQFGIEFAYRFHYVEKHETNATKLANYLSNLATYIPQSFTKRAPHCGPDEKNVCCGGLDASTLIAFDMDRESEYVEVDENVKVKKILNGMKNDPLAPRRMDLGYEYFDYSTIQYKGMEQAKKFVNGHFKKANGADVLKKTDVLLKSEGLQKLMSENCEPKKFQLEKMDECPLLTDLAVNYSLECELSMDSLSGDFPYNGLLFNRMYYYCGKCMTVLTRRIEHHANVCESSDIRLLFHPSMAPNKGMSCVVAECKERLCSVRALRSHAALHHQLDVRFSISDSAFKGTRDIIEYAQQPNRTSLAKFTDADLEMPIKGTFERSLVKLKKVKNMVNSSLDIIKCKLNVGLRSIYSIDKSVYFCILCDFNNNELEPIKMHFIQNHIDVCKNCGRGFTSKTMSRSHTCKNHLRNDGNTLSGICVVCNDRFGTVEYYEHLVYKHIESLRFDVNTSEVFPRITDIKPNITRAGMITNIRQVPQKQTNVQLRSTSSTASTPTVAPTTRPTAVLESRPSSSVVPSATKGELQRNNYLISDERMKKHLRTKMLAMPDNCLVSLEPRAVILPRLSETEKASMLTCFMCEMRFKTKIEMNQHMAKHQLKCQYCPFCGLSTYGFDDFREHMYMKHLKNNGGNRFACEFCSKDNSTSPIVHLLYQCPKIEVCVICDMSITNQVQHHFEKYHKDVLNRFKCSICGMQFMSVGEYDWHVCVQQPKVFMCLCGSSKLFKTTDDYCDHFDAFHYDRERICGLCEQAFPSNRSLAFHRFAHCHLVDASTYRQLIFRMENSYVNTRPTSDTIAKRLSSLLSNGDSMTSVTRTEKDDTPPAATTSHYTEDDDVQEIEFISEEELKKLKEVQKKTTIVKPVENKDNADGDDDEIMVVAEVENSVEYVKPPQKTRAKKFQCTRCSEAFMTQASLSVHMHTHRSDAGVMTSGETFGIPINCRALLCRNCCLAFECPTQYKQHMLIHGNAVQSCKKCSGIAFNTMMLQQHNTLHEQGKISYSCGTCLLRYNNDDDLMHHLIEVHKQKMFWFCKECGFGSTNQGDTAAHVVKHPSSKFHRSEIVGICPVQLLNFEPKYVQEFKRLCANNIIRCVTPSDCSHRTFLLPNELGMVSCKTCHCTQSLPNYAASIMMLASDIVFTMPPRPPHRMMVRGQTSGVSRIYPVKPTEKPHNETTPATTLPNASKSVATTSVVPTTTTPTNPPPKPQTIPALRIEPPIRRNDLSLGEYLASLRSDLEKRDKANPQPMKGCDQCESDSFKGPFEAALHKLHFAYDLKWVCGMCGHAEPEEKGIVLHYYDTHQEETKPPLKLELNCPVNECNTNSFDDVTEFKKHLREHSFIFKYVASCGMPFADETAKNAHDVMHQARKVNNCCFYCGTVDIWEFKDSSLSHIWLHGLNNSTMCRICFKKFPDDLKFRSIAQHFKEEHVKEVEEKLFCKTCSVSLDNMVSHLHQYHLLRHIESSIHSANGEFVIKTGTELINHLGCAQKIIENNL